MEDELKEYYENLKDAIDHIGSSNAGYESKFEMTKTVLLSMSNQIHELSSQLYELKKDYYDLK